MSGNDTLNQHCSPFFLDVLDKFRWRVWILFHDNLEDHDKYVSTTLEKNRTDQVDTGDIDKSICSSSLLLTQFRTRLRNHPSVDMQSWKSFLGVPKVLMTLSVERKSILSLLTRKRTQLR